MSIKFTGLDDNNAYVEWYRTHSTGYVFNMRNNGSFAIRRRESRWTTHLHGT